MKTINRVMNRTAKTQTTKKSNRIMPCLWFDDNAELAVHFYTSIFKNSKITNIARYGESGSQAAGRPKGSIMTVTFELDGQAFMALNGGPIFKFTEAMSLMVNCKDQKELDYYWDKLSEGGDEKAQMCGWLKDKFGLSWQIVPASLGQLMKDPKKSERVMAAVLQMKKLDIKKLAGAYK